MQMLPLHDLTDRIKMGGRFGLVWLKR